MPEFCLQRTGTTPIRFTGDLLITAEATPRGRRLLLEIYRTPPNGLAVSVQFRSDWDEPDVSQVTLHGNAMQALRQIKDTNPTRWVAGYPEGEHFSKKQARLLASIRGAWADLVGRVLTHPVFEGE